MWDQHDSAESGGLPAAGNGYAQDSCEVNGYAQHSGELKPRKKGMSSLRVMLIAIAALVFAGLLLYSQLVRYKPGLNQKYGLKVGSMKGKLKGFPKVKRVVQRRGLAAHHAEGDHHGNHHGDHHHGGASEHAQTITKEMDLDHLEHAGFDPEAAAFEDGMDPEDLGYDVEEEDEEDFAEDTAHADEHHDGEHHDGAEHEHDHHAGGHHHHHGLHGSSTRNLHHVGDDSALHAGEEHLHLREGHPGHHAHVPGHTGPQVPPLAHHGGWKTYEGHEDDPHDREHKIKVRARLAEIFPLIDKNRDMHIDQAEMLAWHDENGRNTSARRAKREFNWADTNKDGQVTLAEYLADLLPEDFHGNETDAQIEASPVWSDPIHEWILHNKETFRLADADRSGGLNLEEHFAFNHPEDADNKVLHAHMRRQDVADRDRNHDGKLDFEEFQDQVWFTIHEWEAPDRELSDDNGAAARARFTLLDVNKDGFLDAEDLAPVFHLLHPREHDYARIQALHQLEAADNSADGKLTLNEMISNPYVFYGSSVIDDEEDDSDTPLHDEF